MFRRAYACDDCGIEFIHSHERKGEPAPDCPACERLARYDAARERAEGEARVQRMIDSGIAPGVRTAVSHAVENTQRAMEDMGYSNFRDNTRDGESIVMEPRQPTTPEHVQLVREVKQYAEQTKNPHLISLTPQDLSNQVGSAWKPAGQSMSAPAPGAAEAKSIGAEPIAMIDGARAKPLVSNFNIQGRAKKE